MSANQGSLATHVPQSLPSFAQAFSSQSLSNMPSGNNSLPPIQTRLAQMDNRRLNSPSTAPHSRPSSEENSASHRTATRKRSRNDVTSSTRDDDPSNSDGSPRLVHIKEEQDQDPPPPPPPARANDHRIAADESETLSPSSLRPPSKKRRVTISGAPHPLNTDVRVPVDQTNSTPISPVVMGFTIKRDNPSAIEQVRSMITVKQKQKALIEQRRGSVAGVMSPNIVTGAPVPPTPAESAKPPVASRSLRRSPNTGTGARRLTNNPNQVAGNPHPPSPSPIVVPSQQALQVSTQAMNANSLPPPPISFARRRAGQSGSIKRKPADILISPREAQTQEQFQPAIQSAPPVPHAGQNSGRFLMALPRLPSAMGGGDNVRRVAGNVPPTPTRLSMQRTATNPTTTQTTSGLIGRSPPAASVPIASTLVPPTPSSLHHPGYSGDKSAFLAPFGVFYDALNDSKQLKAWLGEQLQRSNALILTLTQQQEKINETVDSLVERKVSGMRSEMAGLHRRVEELEDALRIATSGRRHSTDITGGSKSKGKPPRNGVVSGPMVSDTYTFPPVSSPLESSRLRPEAAQRVSSPARPQGESRDNQNALESENGSPAPFDSMRMSVSASRLDPPRSQLSESTSQPRPSFSKQSPPQGFRDTPNHTLPPSAPHGKSSQATPSERERPVLSRQSSSHGPTPVEPAVSPPLRRGDSRRNSVIMSPPDAPEDDG